MKTIALSAIIVFIVSTAFGQSMYVHTKGSATPSTYLLSSVDSITFDISGSTVTGKLHDPVLSVQFDENPYNHNMHIAGDGAYYYTINGGNASYGKINKFTLDGTLVSSYSIALDGRGISYNKADGFLYVSTYLGNVVRITNLATGVFDTVYSGLTAQTSFALSPDGSKFYEFVSGTVKVRNLKTGVLLSTITGLSYGTGNFGGEFAIAVDADYMYTWDAVSRVVSIYTLAGTLVRTMTLSYGDNGMSLSYVDGMLFVSHDGNYGVGTWYGYNIRLESVLSKAIAKAGTTAQPNLTVKSRKSDSTNP
jgi:hypothetical protein